MHDVVILHDDRQGSCNDREYFFLQDGPMQFVVGASLYYFEMKTSPKTYDIIIVGGELHSNLCKTAACTIKC